MRNRLLRVFSVIAIGCSFQVVGCDSQELANILTDSVKSAAVDVTTFVVESGVDLTLCGPGGCSN